jgi:peroxiredoxin
MALSVGSKAPAFTLIDTERKPRSLSEFVGKKTVLAFYPGAFTGVCTKEMCSFRDSLAGLAKVDGLVVGISGDSPFANKAFADQNKLGFPLLSDLDLVVSKQYVGIYEAFAGIAGYKASKRSVFVLDSTGTVKYVWVTENPGVEPPYDEINKALASF